MGSNGKANELEIFEEAEEEKEEEEREVGKRWRDKGDNY